MNLKRDEISADLETNRINFASQSTNSIVLKCYRSIGIHRINLGVAFCFFSLIFLNFSLFLFRLVQDIR